MTAGPWGPTAGPLAPDSAQRTLAHLVKECREVVDAKGPERLCHIWSEDLRRLCDALEAGTAARRAPPKIYLASRSRHGARWRALRDSGVPIISTWIDESEAGQTTDYGDLMRRCIEEAARATAFICYAEGDDIAGWKGVWFEMGAACAAGVPVFFVGTHDFPSALRHPNVTFCADLDGALRAALAAQDRT